MGAADLTAIMDECAARMGAWGDYEDPLFDRAYGWPNPAVNPPAFVVGFPPMVSFDATYGRGMDRISDLPVWLVFGAPDEASARDKVVGRVLEAKARLEDQVHPFEDPAWQSLWVRSVGFETIANQDGTEYIAARLTLDIAT